MQTIEQCEKAMSNLLKRLKNDSDQRLELLKNEMARITKDITELSRYMRMNYSGFIKILKKHDKYTAFKSKPMFMVQLESKPFYKEDFDALIIRMSNIYEMARTGGKKTTAISGSSSQSFIRRTTKYWVHPENVTEVKCIILKYLPVLVYTSKDGKDPDPAISSIYFDNDSFELYQGRLEKSEGAEVFKFMVLRLGN
jgi:SPX domain protein involved in polyphosphate accumulation